MSLCCQVDLIKSRLFFRCLLWRNSDPHRSSLLPLLRSSDRRGGSRGALTTSPPRIPVRSYSSTETRTKVRRVPPPEKSQQGFFHGLFFHKSTLCIHSATGVFGNPTGSQLLMCNVGNTMLGAYPVQSGSALKMSPNHEASLLFFLYLIFYLTFQLCMICNKTFCFGFLNSIQVTSFL